MQTGRSLYEQRLRDSSYRVPWSELPVGFQLIWNELAQLHQGIPEPIELTDEDLRFAKALAEADQS